MLLSGTDNHIAGLGNMGELLSDNQKGKPGYEGVLSEKVTTITSLLQAAGYRTSVAGKWHLGYSKDWNELPITGPLERGFDYHFGVPSNHNDSTTIDRKPTQYSFAQNTRHFRENTVPVHTGCCNVFRE